MDDRQQLRQQIRKMRRQLSQQQRQQAAQQLAQIVQQDAWVQQSHHIAGYIANDGEIDPDIIKQHIWQQQKNYYLPVVHPKDPHRLWFLPYKPGDELCKNRYGILEPRHKGAEPIPPWQLDLVLTPLVAFDDKGNRLGMGGGYYDHTFAFLHDEALHRPHLIGLAYELQHMMTLKAEAWDVPLTAVATEQQLYAFD